MADSTCSACGATAPNQGQRFCEECGSPLVGTGESSRADPAQAEREAKEKAQAEREAKEKAQAERRNKPVVFTIGRARDCDLVVAHSSVSAHHAELHQTGSQYRIVDLSSTNGTFVNGVRLTSQTLKEGDTVHLGPVALEFRSGRLEIGVHEEPDPADVAPSGRSSSSRKTVLAVGVLALAVAAVATLILLSSRGDDESTHLPAPATTVAPATTAAPTTTLPSTIEVGWEQVANSVVYIEAFCDGEWHSGSGTIVLDGGHVLTNHHVIVGDSGDFCELSVWGMESLKADLVFVANGEGIPNALDPDLDLAVIRLLGFDGRPVKAAGRTPIEVLERDLGLGEMVKVLGFPSMGGQSLTMTSGDISGSWEDPSGYWSGAFYKTDAKMGPGISGGAAFSTDTGQFVGVPTGTPGEEDRGDILGLVRPARYAIRLLDAAERAN